MQSCNAFLQADIKTFSVRLGVKRVFWTCIALLEFAYACAIGTGLMSRVSERGTSLGRVMFHTIVQADAAVLVMQVWWSKVATVAIHAGMALLLYSRAQRTDLEDSKEIYLCYMFVWKLFYAEYLFLPLFR